MIINRARSLCLGICDPNKTFATSLCLVVTSGTETQRMADGWNRAMQLISCDGSMLGKALEH